MSPWVTQAKRFGDFPSESVLLLTVQDKASGKRNSHEMMNKDGKEEL